MEDLRCRRVRAQPCPRVLCGYRGACVCARARAAAAEYARGSRAMQVVALVVVGRCVMGDRRVALVLAAMGSGVCDVLVGWAGAPHRTLCSRVMVSGQCEQRPAAAARR